MDNYNRPRIKPRSNRYLLSVFKKAMSINAVVCITENRLTWGVPFPNIEKKIGGQQRNALQKTEKLRF
jgi:hypothetical protein